MATRTRSDQQPARPGAAKTPARPAKAPARRVAQRARPLKAAAGSIAATTKELSGPQWVRRFAGSKAIADLEPAFRQSVDAFIGSIVAAGARVSISATFRPPQRMYLMHWSWRISRLEIQPADVPAMLGVDIEWNHGSLDDSIKAASAMVAAFGTVARPSLTSKHGDGTAIDMTIGWTGELAIKDARGRTMTIGSSPRSGMNPELIRVGATYGVVKARFSDDPPHWSNDGH